MEEMKRQLELLPEAWQERALERLASLDEAKDNAEPLVLGDSAGV